MKYLVTGAAGFIAAKVVENLLRDGHQVVAIDNVNDYYDIRLKYYRMAHVSACAQFNGQISGALDYLKDDINISELPYEWINERLAFYIGDIEDLSFLKALFDEHQCDAVFNLAARAGVRYSMENPYVYLTTNASGTLNLLEQMRLNGVKKMVLASTSSLYAGLPMPFNEELPVNTPISPYAASKKAAESMAYSYHKLYDMDISVVRYFTVFGPAGRPDMSIFRFIKWIDEGDPVKLFGDGTQSRDFTYVDDIAEGTIAAAKPVGYEIINLGGGKNPISLNTIIGWLEELLGKKAKIKQEPFHCADIAETWADISKAERLLGWRPKMRVEEGLSRSVQWYKENKEWLQHIKL